MGAIPLLGSLGIAVGYAIIVGWVCRSIFGAVSGALLTEDSTVYFEEMTGAFGSVPYHFFVIAVTVIILIFGVIQGIEKVNKFMMPAFFLLFLIIAIRVSFLPGAMQGYEYLLLPKWEALLNPNTWVMEIGRAHV